LTSASLNGGSEYHANQTKAFLSREVGGGFFNVPKELLKGDNNPIHYLAATEISEREIALLSRRLGDLNSTHKGYSDTAMIWNVKYVSRKSVNRKSIKEVVQIESGRRDFARDSSFFNRASQMVNPQQNSEKKGL
jgi:hypothetical protein